jgi:general stress protein 26
MALKDQIFRFMGGERLAAVATISDGRPAVRLMGLLGMEDMSLIGVTMKNSRKVEQIKKNPAAQLSIWSGERGDPYMVIQCKAEVHEDLDTKKKFWDPRMLTYFQNPEEPNYVVLKFIPERIEFYRGYDIVPEIWEK